MFFTAAQEKGVKPVEIKADDCTGSQYPTTVVHVHLQASQITIHTRAEP